MFGKTLVLGVPVQGQMLTSKRFILQGCQVKSTPQSSPFPTSSALRSIPYLHSLGGLPHKIHVFHTKFAFTSKRFILQGCHVSATSHKSTFSNKFPLETYPLSSLLRGSSIQNPCFSYKNRIYL